MPARKLNYIIGLNHLINLKYAVRFYHKEYINEGF